MRKTFAAVVLCGLALSGVAAEGQQVLQAPSLAAGDVAPDFTLPGASRYGLLQNPVQLSDYRGSTVVLAFFYQARTKG